MLLSTEGLAVAARSGARRCLRWAGAIVGLAILAQLLALPYHLSVLYGHTGEATIESRRVGENSKGSKIYWVSYRVHGSGERVDERVEADDYPWLTEGLEVPVRVGPLSTTIGPHPTLHGAAAMTPSVGLLIFGTVALFSAFKRRGWYERPLEEEVGGRL
jgi:hypothetical protein